MLLWKASELVPDRIAREVESGAFVLGEGTAALPPP
jgi:hypothetical protein